MPKQLNKERLRWACRRGMLELDLILENYLNNYYEKAEQQEQQNFIDLLEQTDQDLFDWILKKQKTSEAKLQTMINILITHGAKS